MHQRADHVGTEGHALNRPLLTELLTLPGVVEEMTLGSRFGVMAYHGGNLEVGTDRIADAVAERTGASRYVVRQPDDLRWHIPSRHFHPEESQRLAMFLSHVDEVVTIHGYGRRSMFTTVLLGGGNRPLAGHLARYLRAALPCYEVIDELEDIPAPLRGIHPENPVNRPRRSGVQIELPPRVRGNGPFWNGWDGRWPAPHTEDLIEGLVGGLDSWSDERSSVDPPSDLDRSLTAPSAP